MLIRDATREDLEAIVQIYNASIPSGRATADTESITVESRLVWFEQRCFTTRPLWVMEKDSMVVGWLGLQNFYGRPAYQSTAEISLYVAPNYQRQGIGKKLLEIALSRSSSLGIETFLGFIFAHNQASLNLFKQYQFESWGYLPKVARMDGIERDLVILGRRLNS